MGRTLFDTDEISEPKITTLAPWFGGNRMLAESVGQELRGMKWVGVPFAGGMSELLYIDAPSILVSDLHLHIINAGDVEWGLAYFTACWRGRSAKSGTDSEFSGKLPIRWTSSGGDSNTRYRSAIESLEAFARVFQRCNFICMDAFDFIDKTKDEAGHAIYIDAPWPDDGATYKHKFDLLKQTRLVNSLVRFEHTKVVVRFGDHEVIRRLYDESKWLWKISQGRTQANKSKQEVLLILKNAA